MSRVYVAHTTVAGLGGVSGFTPKEQFDARNWMLTGLKVSRIPLRFGVGEAHATYHRPATGISIPP